MNRLLQFAVESLAFHVDRCIFCKQGQFFSSFPILISFFSFLLFSLMLWLLLVEMIVGIFMLLSLMEKPMFSH